MIRSISLVFLLLGLVLICATPSLAAHHRSSSRNVERIEALLSKIQEVEEVVDRLAAQEEAAQGEAEIASTEWDAEVAADDDADEVVRLTNAFRAKNGLPALEHQPNLDALSKEHSQNMASGRTPFGHDGFSERVKRYGFSYRSAAENVAQNYGGADKAVNQWINSAGHRKNMLSQQAKKLGAGSATSKDGKVYWTQLFG